MHKWIQSVEKPLGHSNYTKITARIGENVIRKYSWKMEKK
jgi:hypothetical protein